MVLTGCASTNRKLNLVTVADPAPMTTAKDLFGKLGKCQYYSTIDLSIGCWQIPVAQEDIHKTAFVTPDSCYEFLRMLFGMKNSGAALVLGMRIEEATSRHGQCRMLYRRSDCLHKGLGYLSAGALYTFGKTKTISWLSYSTYLVRVWLEICQVFRTFHRRKLHLHHRGELMKIRGAKRPTTKKEVRSFLGLANYYRDHIPSFAAIAAPLSDPTKKVLPESVRWEDAQEKAFVTLRESLVRGPMLRQPDHNKTFILRTDASNCGLGAALMQEQEGRFFPVAYGSKKLTSAERK